MARLRTFIAVELPGAVRARCVELQEELAGSADAVKWVEEENLHVTLLFLGDVGDRDVIDVCRAAAKACASRAPFPLVVEGTGAFPNARRPRTIWAGITTGAAELVALHDALEGPLLALGCYRREERRYSPHVTLGRVKGDRPDDRLAAALEAQSDWHGGEGEVAEVLVMSSQLTPQGPVYSVMSRAPLGVPG
jgi:RNA 2',3'-cyclic 3'-phosphodiesterase